MRSRRTKHRVERTRRGGRGDEDAHRALQHETCHDWGLDSGAERMPSGPGIDATPGTFERSNISSAHPRCGRPETSWGSC